MATLFTDLQFLDGNGDPLSYGKLYWYEAGTTNFKDTWKDQAEGATSPNPIILDIEGRVSVGQNGVWIRGSYKLVIKNSLDVEIPGGTFDNFNEYDSRDWSGLTASIADLNSTTTNATIVTGATTITLADRNKTILCDATSGAFVVTLPTVASVGDTFRIYLKKIDSTINIVSIETTGSQDIDGETKYDLRTLNSTVEVHSDGNTWWVISAERRKNIRTITATETITNYDDRSTLVVNASAGAVNITLPTVASSGTAYRVTIKKFDLTSNLVSILPSGGSLIDGAGSLIISVNLVAHTLITNSTDWFIESTHAGSAAISHLPIGYIKGLFIAPNGAAKTTEITFKVGVCRDKGNTIDINQNSIIIKKINATWTQGTNQGGLADNLSLLPSTGYFTFVIAKLDGTVDCGFDTDYNCNNLLRIVGAAYAAGFRVYRRTGWIWTDGVSDIKDFYMFEQDAGRTTNWVTPIVDAYITPVNASGVITLLVPHGLYFKAQIMTTLEYAGTGWLAIYFQRYGYTVAPAVATGRLHLLANASVSESCVNTFDVVTDTLRQITYTAVGSTVPEAAANINISTMGWIDPL